MVHRRLIIGRWEADFLFMPDEYDVKAIAEYLYDAGASSIIFRQAKDLVWMCDANCGFTFTNPDLYRAVVVIGPATSGAEFINTLVHEVHHLAVAIADNLGIDLEGEGPAYIAGDSARDLAETVCELGCPCCH
jgi:hypothetical protein